MRSRRCPGCGHEQTYKLEACERCSLVFAKWDAKRIREEQAARRPAPPPTELEVWKGRLPVLLPLAVLAVALWRLLAPPASAPLVPGSFLSRAHQFALQVPSGWKIEEKDELRGDFASVLTLRSEGDFPEIPAVVGVALTEKPIPREVGYNRVGDFQPFVSAVLPGSLGSDFVIGSVRLERLDGLRALYAEGTGYQDLVRTETVMVPIDPVKGSWFGGRYLPPKVDPSRMRPELQTASRREPIRFLVYAARSADKTVLLGAACRLNEFAGRQPALQSIVSSFRVLYRPYSLKHLASRALFELRGETLAFLLSLAWLLYKWILGDLFE